MVAYDAGRRLRRPAREAAPESPAKGALVGLLVSLPAWAMVVLAVRAIF